MRGLMTFDPKVSKMTDAEYDAYKKRKKLEAEAQRKRDEAAGKNTAKKGFFNAFSDK